MEYKNKKYYNLTHPQKRIWYIDKINVDSPIHNIGGSLKIKDVVDVEKLKETLNLIIKNNDGLRLRMTEKSGQPFQYVSDYEEKDIDFMDFSYYEKPEEECEKWTTNLFEMSFKLEDNQLYYMAIYKINEKEYGVLVKIHHIIADGWSFSLIQDQICKIYSKLIKNEEINFEKIFSYIDFVKEEEGYLNSTRFIKNKEYWSNKFDDVDEEFLYKTSNNIEGKRKSFDIDNELSEKIKKFSEDKKCSLNTLFIMSLIIYINKTTYKKDIVIGTPVFNRWNKKQKSMIGMFTSTVPLKFNLDDKSSAKDLIKLINKELKLCFLNQKYPYDMLIRDLELGGKGYDSLFKMSVNYYNTKYVKEMNNVKFDVEEYYSGNQSYSMQLVVKEWEDNNITLNFDYKIKEYSDNEIQVMYNSIINIITEILSEEELKVMDVKLLNKKEINKKIYDFNSNISCYPNKTVYELIEKQAIKTPYNIALDFEGKKITYEQLNKKSNKIANYLQEKGIKRDQVVGIMAKHSIELVAAILGILKAGGAYMPIDPNYPIERVNYMLKDSKSTMLLTNYQVMEKLEFERSIINVNELNLELYSEENLKKVNGLRDLAYVIYTSGSTGKPKGVMIEHRGLTNYIWWAKKVYLKNENESMPLYSSISFDLTVTSIFTPLISGNKILIYEDDGEEFILYKILRENKATVIKLTPAHLTLLKDMDNRSSNIKRFIVGGEDLKVSLAKKIYDSFGNDIEIFNEYGPTETVVGCMIYKYDDKINKSVSVPIGKPADNVQIYILDKDFNPTLTGAVGDLYISGDGVARGYLNREELTNERFIENPFIKGSKMYKTGDTARYLENGLVEYVGRSDNQVKLRGYRIELGEIEKRLIENEAVKEAVVLLKDDSNQNKVLTAYVVLKKEVQVLELKKWLLSKLPKYMLPNNFIFIEELPLTINGKIDYKSFPKQMVSKDKFENAKSDVEEAVVKVMKEILGIQNISMKDNYYQLGGDSIKAIQISSKLKDLGLKVAIKDILNYEYIEEIAAAVKIEETCKSINQDDAEGEIYNIPIVNWFFNQSFLNENCYNQYVILECKEKLDTESVKIAVNKLLKHHDALRINYSRKNNKLYYNNKYLKEDYIVNCFECTKNDEINDLISMANIEFDIERELLFNVTMFNMEDDRQKILFTAHHLIVDGISWRIILSDFATIINQLNCGKELKLPLKTYSFRDWSRELKNYSKKDFKEEKNYWDSLLDKKFIYPVDFDREEDRISTSKVFTDFLNEDITNVLIKKTNEIYSIELNEILIIGLVCAINRITGSRDIVIELERHGREALNENIDISRTVGWFTSMYPAYFKLEDKEIDDAIKALKEQLRGIPKYGFNYSLLKFLKHEIKELGDKYIRFNYLGDFDNVIDGKLLDLNSISFGLNSGEENKLTALMDIEAMIINKKLQISITFSTNRFKEETIKDFINCYISELQSIGDFCSSKESKEFTPSDFDTVDISQEDLDSLFE
ncbi:amino acid adenylation domain-containing protein [Clostridium felsineum]|uniref:amino acid adenylation domain-containing protein n=1 Tax=Clostridium felsineum TaxID=36839 RepID=UPI00214D673F|nr:amino acid adenylation domain-containing protein [Clostridium felsineum]MCR3759003.1 amino acid adenylation domain-containing protein [Clostridium felsineum]